MSEILIHRAPANSGYLWLKNGFLMYRKSPLFFSLVVLSWLMLPLITSRLVPIAGGVLGDYIQSIVGVGFFQLGRTLRLEGRLDPKLLLSRFSDNGFCMTLLWLKGLFYFGLFLFVAALIGINAAFGLSSKDLMSIAQIIQTNTLYLIPESTWWFIAINLGACGIAASLAGAALIFAAPLIAFQRFTIWKAIKGSFLANCYNWKPIFLLTLLSTICFILALIPLGIGLLVFAPVMNLSLFQAYEAILTPPNEPNSIESLNHNF